MNKNEKLALDTIGMEGSGKQFVVNDRTATDIMNDEIATKYNEGVNKIVDKFEKHNQAIADYAKEISHDIDGLEIVPMSNYALIKPFETNPFQQVKIENGIITDLGGMTPTYKSHETGEIEESEQYIKVGTVIEPGYQCEYLKAGDIVFYTIASEVKIPFFRQGFVVVNENRIMAVVNSGLTNRSKKLKNGK